MFTTSTPPAPASGADWGDIPTWVGAIGTCVATVAVIVTGVFVFLTFRKQAEALADQKAANDRQAAELSAVAKERKREAIERHRAQAAQVFLWIERKHATSRPPTSRLIVHVHNTSRQPVYDVRIRWHQGSAPWMHEGEDSTELAHVMPDIDHTESRIWDGGGNLAMVGAVVEFTDAAGVQWMRREGGELTEQP